jgi:hypothetical protein
MRVERMPPPPFKAGGWGGEMAVVGVERWRGGNNEGEAKCDSAVRVGGNIMGVDWKAVKFDTPETTQYNRPKLFV